MDSSLATKLQRLEAKICLLTEENAGNTTRIIMLEDSLAKEKNNFKQLNKTVSELKTQLRDQQNQVEPKAELPKTFKDDEAKAGYTSSQVESTKNRIEQVDKSFESRLCDSEKKADCLEGALNKMKIDVKDMTNKNSFNESFNEYLNTQLSEAKGKIESLEEKVENLETSLRELSHEKQSSIKLGILEKELQSAQTDINDRFLKVDKNLQKNHSDVKSMIQNVSQDLQRTQTDINDRFLKGEKNFQKNHADVKGMIKNVSKNLQRTQTDINNRFQKMTEFQKNLSAMGKVQKNSDAKIGRCEASLKVMKNQMDKIQQNISAVEKVQETSGAKSDRCEASLKKMENQVEKNKTVMSTMKSNQDTMVKTGFVALLENSSDQTTNVDARLDRCQKVKQASVYFDQATGWFTVPQDGIYQWNVTVNQRGKGRLQVSVGPDDGIKHYVVFSYYRDDLTDLSDDARSGSVTLRLDKGQKLGVWVKRTLGDAKVEWCRLSGCLVCPSD